MPQKEGKFSLSKLSYILLSLIGILMIILLIVGTCTDTFKSISIYKLPVLTPQETSRLGTEMSIPVHKGLSNIEKGVVPRFRRSYEIPKEPEPSSAEPSSAEPSSAEPSSAEPSSAEPRVPWMPMLKLFTPNTPENKLKEPSLYSRLKNAANSGNL